MESNGINIKDIRSFIEDWNDRFPIDKWFRDKYNIPFGSKSHLDQSFLDMRLDFEEKRADQIREINEFNEKSEDVIKYKPGYGDWLKEQPKYKEMSSLEVDSTFDDLVNNMSKLRQFDDSRKEDGKIKIKI